MSFKSDFKTSSSSSPFLVVSSSSFRVFTSPFRILFSSCGPAPFFPGSGTSTPASRSFYWNGENQPKWIFVISNVTTSPSGFGDDVCEMKQNRGWIFPPDATVQSAPPVGVSTGGAAPSAHRWGSVTNYMLTSWSLSRSHASIRVSSDQRCQEPCCNRQDFYFYFSPSKSGAAG